MHAIDHSCCHHEPAYAYNHQLLCSLVTATSASSKTAMSSTVVLIEPSSSIVESLMSSSEVVMEAVKSVVTGSTAVEYIFTNIIPQDTTTGSVRSTNNRGMHSESTTQFRPVLTRPPVRGM